MKQCACAGYRYVQFSVRVGSGTAVGSCPSPDMDNELIIVQSTCNGGIDWHLLRMIDVSDKFAQPMYLCSFVVFFSARLQHSLSRRFVTFVR